MKQTEPKVPRSGCDQRSLGLITAVVLVAGGIGWVLAAEQAHERLSSAFGTVAGPDSSLARFNTEGLLIPKHRIVSGGVSKDGIPSLVNPHVVPIAEADFIKADDRVVGVAINGQFRAYPINVLNWHEVINDWLGGTGPDAIPIAVVYCPLCDSVSVVDRRLDGKVYEFGVSGLLLNSNVLMYDRTEQALWSQVGLVAVSGPHAGRALNHIGSWKLTGFEAWKNNYPKSTVVSFHTGFRRDYNRNPYKHYLQSDRLMFPTPPADRRLKNKTPIIGIKLGPVIRAYPAQELYRAPGGSVLDVLAGQKVHLVADANSGMVHILEVPKNAQVVHTFWFAWVAFHPETEVYRYPPDR